MYKDLFTVFGYTLQSHSVMSIVAIILGYGVALGMARGTAYYKHIQNFVIPGVIAAIIGARLWHVFVFHWSFYAQHPLQIVAIWAGGISIEGAIVGGIVAVIVYVYVHKINFWEFADYLSPAMILAMGIGRIACFLAGDAFGRPTGGSWGVTFPAGTIAHQYYGSQALWPSIAFESQGDMVLFAILFILFTKAGKRLANGWVFLFFVFLYDLERFLLGFTRGDSPRDALNLTGGQWSAIVMMVISLGLMVYLLVRYGLMKKEEPEPETGA
ncbi:MAG TPA: prolipoprotein diacylglyceryl transferase [Bacillales bacterium]|nr:prolipoprotein diacylglyceryl transferase [Bacillales bacterium]